MKRKEVNMYISIRLDLKHSREDSRYEDMNSFFSLIHKSISQNTLATNPIIQLQVRNGDELFGVYDNAKEATIVISAILNASKKMNIPIYLGIGMGYLNQTHNRNAHEINGESIWMATTALNDAKEFATSSQLITCVFKSNKDNLYDSVINLLFEYLIEILEKRNEQQQEAVMLLDAYPDTSYSELYEKLTSHGTTTTDSEKKRIYFTRYLSRSRYDKYNKILETISDTMNRGLS